MDAYGELLKAIKADCEVIQNQKKPKTSINEVQKKSKWEWESINHLTYWDTKSEVRAPKIIQLTSTQQSRVTQLEVHMSYESMNGVKIMYKQIRNQVWTHNLKCNQRNNDICKNTDC